MDNTGSPSTGRTPSRRRWYWVAVAIAAVVAGITAAYSSSAAAAIGTAATVAAGAVHFARREPPA